MECANVVACLLSQCICTLRIRPFLFIHYFVPIVALLYSIVPCSPGRSCADDE